MRKSSKRVVHSMPFVMEEEEFLLHADPDEILTEMFHKEIHKEKPSFSKGDANLDIIRLKAIVEARYDKQIEAVKRGETPAAERCFIRGDTHKLMAKRDHLLQLINDQKIEFLWRTKVGEPTE